ncbi:MAG TPA: TonB-dependent receptor [Candidatus Sulfotelmatobacter sp.]
MRLRAKHAFLVCLVAGALAALVQTGAAQTFSSSIAGVVTDPSGSVVAGAKVHLRNMNTNDERDVASTATGTYKFDNLLPGTYEITAESAGFKTYVQSNMILSASTAATVNIPLAIGGAEQRVEVTAGAVLLDTETAKNAVTLDSRLVESLPNSYRNPLNFVFALAGTTEAQSGMTSRSTSFDQMGSMFGLTGGRIGNAQILIDGAPSTAVDWGGLFVSPNQDAVQEQQVIQNVYDAQYERSGAGVVTLVTKSGTNSFHGSVYDYFRNSALDANSWANGLSTPVTPKNLFHRNQFGATFGGPISRSRHLFFYVDYEGLRQPDIESSGFLTVPTDKMHSGDFSELSNQIFNPFSTRPSGSGFTRDPFLCDASGNPSPVSNGIQSSGTPCNKIPSSLFDPVGQKILGLYPSPTQGGLTFNYYKQGRGTTDNDKFDWRIDWAQSDKNRIFARMSDRVRQNYTPACFFCNGGDNNATNNDRGFQVVINDAYTPNPTWVVDTYVAVGHWHEEQTSIGLGKGDASKIGLSPSLFQAPLLPLVNVQNYQTLGSTYSSYDFYVRSHGTAIGNVTKEFAKHTIKFGANYDISFMNNRQDVPGTFNFNMGFTECDGAPPCVAPPDGGGPGLSGDAIASLLLGTGSGTSAIQMDPAMSLHTFGVYAQDQWRATPRLTVTAGLRYENQRPATERYNRLTYFDQSVVNPISSSLTGFGPVRGAFEYANKNNRYAWEPDNKNFAPRLGIAYKITDKLVGRVGAGIFYSPASAMISFDQPGQFLGFTSTTNWIGSQNSQGYVPTNLVSNPFPNGLVQPVGSGQGAMTLVGDGASQIWPKGPHPIGYSEQWSADLQYQVGRHAVAEIGYTGSRGHRLMYGNPNLNADQLPTKDLALGNTYLQNQVPNPFYGIITDPNSPLSGAQVSQAQLLLPFPEYTYLVWNRSFPGAQSAYDALNLKFTKQFSGGLSLVSTFVWSKALDDGSEDFIGWTIGNMWRDSYNPKLDYAISTHDVPHSFATALVYQVPYGSGKQWGSAAPAAVRGILGNWEVSGVIRLASGLPMLPPYYSNDSPLSNYGFPGPGLADLVGDPKPAHQTANNWINAAAFQDPNLDASGNPTPISRFGNEPARMTQIREGATRNVDFAVAKGFNVTERFKAQFRAEFLNAFNHPQYGGEFYGNYYGSSNITNCLDCGYPFGQVIGTRNDPRNIQMSLKVTF